MKQTFSQAVREDVFNMSIGYCQRSGCTNRGVDFHHRLPNYQRYWTRFPLFIQSVFNAILLCRECHDHYGLYAELKITTLQAETYEKHLRNLKYE